MKKWRVEDWAGNVMYDGKLFDSFDDARSYITEQGRKLCKTDEELEEYEGEMYAEEVEVEDEEVSHVGSWGNSFNEKMSILEGESTVMVGLLTENAQLVRKVKGGASKDECLAFVNENW
jgi:hypothetical protein